MLANRCSLFGHYHMSHGQSRSKYWCFTLNNPTHDEVASIQHAVTPHETATYIIYGTERGDSGTPHLQGYLELTARTRRSAVKSIAGLSRAHLEPRKGSQKQAIDYCKKDGNFIECGKLKVSHSGTRSDLAEVKDLLDGGASDLKIAEEHFGSFIRYHSSFELYRQLVTSASREAPSVFYIYGDTGTGKTRIVYENTTNLWINSDPTLKWLDGYAGEGDVLLDDYRGEAPDAYILRLLDRYPFRVPVKGGFRIWKPLRIFITSNLPCDALHSGVHAAFRRRINRVTCLNIALNFDNVEDIARIWQQITRL